MRRTISFIVAFLFIGAAIAQSDNCPCCSENHTAFDFWIGEWTVQTADGNLAGHNSIVKIQDGCVIQENWSSARAGYTGTSYNFFNSNSGQWEQIWVDNQGLVLHLKGTRIGNQMILKSDPVLNKEGASVVQQITWTSNDDGTVRQLWESLTNGEANILFDGLYKKEE